MCVCVYVCCVSPGGWLRIKHWKDKSTYNINIFVRQLNVLIQKFPQTFGLVSMCDEDDDEDDEDQQQEGSENVAQRQEKVVSLIWQNNIDDLRWLGFGGVWITH